ncbi:translation initiation factor eIF-2B [Nanoarchaeota archaeon]
MSFKKIVSDIKALNIQGAENVAKAAIKAFHDILNKSKASNALKLVQELKRAKETLLNTRPTEPAMRNALNYILYELDTKDIYETKHELVRRMNYVLDHFEKAPQMIQDIASQKIKNKMIVFTHCHSSTVTSTLKKAKKEGKSFEVHNTETRPLFQGRITAKELTKAGIPVTMYVDSASRLALKKADLMLLGADAITVEGKIVNKIGSELMAEIASKYDVPLYVCADSWKFDPTTIKGKDVQIEERSPKEVWISAPKKVKIANYAFERIDFDLITGVITELGVYRPSILLEELKKAYPWMFKA